MNKTDQLLKELAQSIISAGSISSNTVEFIMKKLSRKEQKRFLSLLKLENSKQTVTVSSATALSVNEKKEIEKKYIGKKIEYVENEELGGGLIIRDFDTIYDATIRNYVDQTIVQLKK